MENSRTFWGYPTIFQFLRTFQAHTNHEGTHFKIWSNLSTTATLGTEESSHCSPLSRKSDQHQLSPHYINALSKAKGVRINKLITKMKILIFYQILSTYSLLGNVWRSVWRIFVLILGLKEVERWDILLFGHPLAEYWSTGYQAIFCQHVSWISVDMTADY